MIPSPSRPSRAGDVDLSRRMPLLALGGAALAALANSSRAEAGRQSRRARKRAKQRADKRCRQQVEECQAAYSDMCEGLARPECFEIRDALQDCCGHLADCEAGETLACMTELSIRDTSRRRGLLPHAPSLAAEGASHA